MNAQAREISQWPMDGPLVREFHHGGSVNRVGFTSIVVLLDCSGGVNDRCIRTVARDGGIALRSITNGSADVHWCIDRVTGDGVACVSRSSTARYAL